MSAYLRPRVPGATIFTVALRDRGSPLLVDEVDRLRDAVRATGAERPFGIVQWVVLPDHLHCIWTLPAGDADCSVRWRLIKARFSSGVPMEERRASHVRRGERGLWQRRFWGEARFRRSRMDRPGDGPSAERAEPRRRSRSRAARGRAGRHSTVLPAQPGEARSGRGAGGLAVVVGPPRPRAGRGGPAVAVRGPHAPRRPGRTRPRRRDGARRVRDFTHRGRVGPGWGAR